MRSTLLALALLGLSACAQPTATKTAQASGGSTATNEIQKPETRSLEEKISRLESNIEFLIQDRKEYKEQITKYKACAARCSEIGADWSEENKPSKAELERNRQCWDGCDEYKPDEIVGC
jgi:TolA-binding protein